MSFSNHTFTYSTRIAPHPVLGAVAALCCGTERRLHAHLMRGGSLDQDLKEKVMRETGLPGRYCNGITTTLQGRVDAVLELRKLEIANCEERVKRIAGKVEALQEELETLRAEADKAKKRLWRIRRAIHGKKRKLASVAHRLAWLKADMERPAPSLCFGSKRLFRRQFPLKENGYRTHDEWLADWRSARSAQFMVPGSHDEVSGNKTCVATVAADGTISLSLLIPEKLRPSPEDDHLVLTGLRFGHGHAEVVQAIEAAEATRPQVLAYQAETRRQVDALRTDGAGLDKGDLDGREKALRKQRNDAARQARAGHTTALTWKFRHDGTGWRVDVNVNRRLEVADWGFAHGAIGLDLNVGFISLMPVDHSGNPLKALSVDFPVETASLSSDRTKAVLGDAVKRIVDLALGQRRPIVIEKLNFQRKKAALKETAGPDLARRLSSFAYNLFKAMLHSRAARFGVRVIEVDPAYTSHMGRAKYARPLGISVHRAAAAMIARRGMGLSEGLSASAELPVGDGRHVTLSPPERMGRRHVWRSWGKHFGRYKAKRKALDAAGRKTRSARARNPTQVGDPALARSQKSGHPTARVSRPGQPGPQPPLLLGGRPASACAGGA